MHKRVWLLFAIYFYAVTPVAMAKGVAIAKCVGDICISTKVQDAQQALRKYGNGLEHKDQDNPNLEVHCYYDASQKIWFELELSPSETKKGGKQITGLFVTSIQICPMRYVTKQAFPVLSSENGVAIGDAEYEVLNKQGQPKRRDHVKEIEAKSPYLRDSTRYSSKVGSYRLVYDSSELLFNFYGFESGKLVSMWLADRE